MNTGTFTVAIRERPARIMTKDLYANIQDKKDIERKFELLYQKHRKIIQENARVKRF